MNFYPCLCATYRIESGPADIERIARFVAYEQTVELPEQLVQDPRVREHVVGRVSEIRPAGPGAYDVVVRYAAHLVSGQMGQLLNLIFGNVSMLKKIRLTGLELPRAVLDAFAGPKFGIDGLRRMTGVYNRPLLATAVKPRGLPDEQLAELAYAFALGGGDIVKDDQNLVAPDFEAFKHRVDLCAKAVERANAQTGRNCLYFPHLAANADELDRYAEFVQRLGLRGVLACPINLGVDTARKLCGDYGLAMMAHPSLTGAFTSGEDHGIAHDVLLGTLFRLAGADISIFPAPGGRFDYSTEQVRGITRALRDPLGALKPAFPCPAGGMRYDSIPTLSREYGAEAVFLIGGSLLGHSDDLAASTRAYQERIAEHFTPRLEEPEPFMESACEFNPGEGEGVHTLLHFREGFHWTERSDRPYKASETTPAELGFTGVRRVELIGRNGEQTDFDLRYFELEPGGYTSLEKHLHTHVIITVRGQGTLLLDARQLTLKPMDVAYVRPLEVHQLRNEGSEPYGFFCVVDRERDRPMRP